MTTVFVSRAELEGDDPAGALRSLSRAADALERELGVEPGAELRRLEGLARRRRFPAGDGPASPARGDDAQDPVTPR